MEGHCQSVIFKAGQSSTEVPWEEGRMTGDFSEQAALRKEYMA
jgi:hypothetical protein